MKKSFFYIAGLTVTAFGLFAAFTDAAQTDEQKIEAAYTAKVDAFKQEEDATCSVNALSTAQDEVYNMAAAAAEGRSAASLHAAQRRYRRDRDHRPAGA